MTHKMDFKLVDSLESPRHLNRNKLMISREKKPKDNRQMNYKYNIKLPTIATLVVTIGTLAVTPAHLGPVEAYDSWRNFDTPAVDNSRPFALSHPSMPSIFGNFQQLNPNSHLLIPSSSSTGHTHQIVSNNQLAMNPILYATTETNVKQNEQVEANNMSATSSLIEAAKSMATAIVDSHSSVADTSLPSSLPITNQISGTPTQPVAADPPKQSPLGKILDSALQAAVASVVNVSQMTNVTHSSSNESTKSEPSKDATLQAKASSSSVLPSSTSSASPVTQTLKPRKQHQPNKPQANSLEQQIINQHARLHPIGTHQRLLAKKHHDNKVVSAVTGSSIKNTFTSSIKDSPLFDALFCSNCDNYPLKSGITSRSSIVKAISDNKLARTLTTVGKTLAGNRYVAGAAAASAVAALGLTVSKLLSPYIFSGGFSKMGDPMMSSGSFSSPSFSNYMSPTDRNYLYSGASDMMLTSASSPSFKLSGQQYSSSPYSFYSYGDSSLDSSSSSSPMASTYYPSYVMPTDQQMYAYSESTKVPQMKSHSSKTSLGETGGHYTDFYAQQGASSGIDSDSSNIYGSFSSVAQSNQPTTYVRYTPQTIQNNEHSAGERPNYDQIVASSTIDNQMTSQQQPQYPTQYLQSKPPSWSVSPTNLYSTTSRRSGSVALKMDDRTRAKLRQQLQEKRKQNQLTMRPTNEFYYTNLADTSKAPAGASLLTETIPADSPVDSFSTTANAKLTRIESMTNIKPTQYHGLMIAPVSVRQLEGQASQRMINNPSSVSHTFVGSNANDRTERLTGESTGPWKLLSTNGDSMGSNDSATSRRQSALSLNSMQSSRVSTANSKQRLATTSMSSYPNQADGEQQVTSSSSSTIRSRFEPSKEPKKKDEYASAALIDDRDEVSQATLHRVSRTPTGKTSVKANAPGDWFKSTTSDHKLDNEESPQSGQLDKLSKSPGDSRDLSNQNQQATNSSSSRHHQHNLRSTHTKTQAQDLDSPKDNPIQNNSDEESNEKVANENLGNNFDKVELFNTVNGNDVEDYDKNNAIKVIEANSEGPGKYIAGGNKLSILQSLQASQQPHDYGVTLPTVHILPKSRPTNRQQQDTRVADESSQVSVAVSSGEQIQVRKESQSVASQVDNQEPSIEGDPPASSDPEASSQIS